MDNNLYHLLLAKGKRVCAMADFIDSLEPGIDDVGHIVTAIYTAYDLVDRQVPMSIKFLTEVYKSFFNTDAVYFRKHPVRITAPTKRHDPIYKSAQVDFSALLDWCEHFNWWDADYANAAQLYYDLWAIHPIDDGNKRTSMILIEAWCYKQGMPSIYIPKKDIQTLKIKLFEDDIEGIAELFERRS